MLLRVLFATFVVLVLMPAQAQAQCSNPAGNTADIFHNTTYNAPVYCDGTNWIAMVGGDPAGQIVVPDGLVAYWRFDEASGTTVLDSIGGNNGTHNNASPGWQVDGAVNRSLDMNGTTDRVDVPSFNVDGDGGMTITFWMKWDGVNVDGRIISKADGTFESNHDWAVIINGGTGTDTLVRFTTVNGSDTGNFFNTINNPGDYNRWIHLALVYDPNQANEMSMYKNGVLQGSVNHVPGGNIVINSSKPIGIGNHATGQGDRPFDGAIDDLRVYQRVLSASEISEIYSTTSTIRTQVVPNGLVGHWRLDETSGTTAFDSSGNGNDATLNVMTLPAASDSGVILNSFTFTNGDSTIVTAPSSENFNFGTGVDFSLSAWVKTTDSDSFIIAKFNSGIQPGYVLELNGSGEIQAMIRDGEPLVLCSGPVVNDGEWHHVAASYTRVSDVIVYVDGEEVASCDISSVGNIDNTENLRFGRRSAGGSTKLFDGNVDDIRIYDRALDEDEIREIYEARDGIRYNESFRSPEYFDGNKFVPMRPDFPDVTDGLVGHWKLDETTGTTAFDSSGNGNDGYLEFGMDATNDSVAGARSRALEFDGIDDRINASDVSLFDLSATPHTFSLWFKTSGPQIDAYPRFLERYNFGTSHEGYRLGFFNTAGTIQALFGSAGVGDGYSLISTGTFDDGSWHHLVVVADGSTATMYVNRIVEATDPYDNLADHSQILEFGGQNTGNSFRGVLDDIRIYNRALSVSEIQTLYTMGAPVGATTALPQGCPNIGDVCDDGTIYVGLSPDGDVPMFAAPFETEASLPHSSIENYPDGFVLTGFGSAEFATGFSNTNTLAAMDADSFTSGFQPHPAATYCYGLISSGASDWYLPGRSELVPTLTGLHTGGLPIVYGVQYWASCGGNDAANPERGERRTIFEDGSIGSGWLLKTASRQVRCVRKGPAPRCANPYGLEGQMVFNTNGNVVQYCDGARWIAIGKRAP
jgi:hypothetical protein